MNKPRIIKDYEKLEPTIQEQIKLHYPRGFEKHLIKLSNKEGKMVSALPFETDDRYYLIRMTVSEALEIIEDDDDYDKFGILKDEVKVEYEDKYDLELDADEVADDEEEVGEEVEEEVESDDDED
jgi:hypothetical protein